MGASNINIPFLIFTTIGTSTAITLPYEETKIPKSVEYRGVSNTLAFNNEPIQSFNDSFSTIMSFSQKLILNSRNIDDEFQEIINKRFWDLL